MDGAKLVYWMAKKKITAVELAEKLSVSETYVSNLRMGQRPGSIKIWTKIAEALEIEFKELL